MKRLNHLSSVSLFLIISAVYLAGYFAHALYLHKTVYGDGMFYYAWLTLTPSKYSIGPALFWAPVYLLTHNQIAVGATSVFATLCSLLLLWNLLAKKFSNTVSIMTIAAIAGTSNLLFYGSLDVVNSHALSLFGTTVFLSLVYTKQKQWVAIGVALGFLGLIRPQDLVFGLLLIPLVKKYNVVKLATGFMIGFLPQLIAWQMTSGKFWLSPYFSHEGFNFLTPHVTGVLFGLQNGLFLWTPITLLGAVGLIMKKQWIFLTVLFLEIYLVACWSTWWQGASYSGRMFVSSLPLLSFGIAHIFARLAQYKWTQAYYLLTVIIPLFLINSLLITSFLLALH